LLSSSNLMAISLNCAPKTCYLSSHYCFKSLLVLMSLDISLRAFWYLASELGIPLETIELVCWLIYILIFNNKKIIWIMINLIYWFYLLKQITSQNDGWLIIKYYIISPILSILKPFLAVYGYSFSISHQIIFIYQLTTSTPKSLPQFKTIQEKLQKQRQF
jgi:hypothetical protein